MKELTDTQKSLFDTIKSHELSSGNYVTAPIPSHHGTSVIMDVNTGEEVFKGFQKRTFFDLVEKGYLVQTMYSGYRLFDDNE